MAALISLNALDADLTIKLEDEGMRATVRIDGHLSMLWGGVRGTVGVARGKYHFRVKLEKTAKVGIWPPLPEGPLSEDWTTPQLSARIGVSKRSVKPALLGEGPGSWAYDSSGKAYGDDEIVEYGQPFEHLDEIGCFVDWGDDNSVLVSFSKNGEWLLEAFALEGMEEPLFPHIALRGMSATVSFQGDPVMGHQCWQAEAMIKAVLCQKGHYVIPHALPAPPAKCSATFVVGLSGAGKTEWCMQQAVAHLDKQYKIIGIESLLEQLHLHKVSVEERRSPQFAGILKHSNDLIGRLVHLAAIRRQNYLLDHYTLAFKGARTKKLSAFPAAKFIRKAAVIVLEEAVYAENPKRAANWGPFSSVESAMNTKVGFSYPTPDEDFDEVLFVDQRPPKADAIVEKLKKEAQLYFSNRKRRSQVLARETTSGANLSGKPDGAAEVKKPRLTGSPQTSDAKPDASQAPQNTQDPPKLSQAPTPAATKPPTTAAASAPPKPAGTEATTKSVASTSGPGTATGRTAPPKSGRDAVPQGSKSGRGRALPPPIAMPRPRLGPQPYNPAILPEPYTPAVLPGRKHELLGQGNSQQGAAIARGQHSANLRTLQPHASQSPRVSGPPGFVTAIPSQQPDQAAVSHQYLPKQQPLELQPGHSMAPSSFPAGQQRGMVHAYQQGLLGVEPRAQNRQQEQEVLPLQRRAHVGDAMVQPGDHRRNQPESYFQPASLQSQQESVHIATSHGHLRNPMAGAGLPERQMLYAEAGQQHNIPSLEGQVQSQPRPMPAVKDQVYTGRMPSLDSRQSRQQHFDSFEPQQLPPAQFSGVKEEPSHQLQAGKGFWSASRGMEPQYLGQDQSQVGILPLGSQWQGQIPSSSGNDWARPSLVHHGLQGAGQSGGFVEEADRNGLAGHSYLRSAGGVQAAINALQPSLQPSLQSLNTAARPHSSIAPRTIPARPLSGMLLNVFEDRAPGPYAEQSNDVQVGSQLRGSVQPGRAALGPAYDQAVESSRQPTWSSQGQMRDNLEPSNPPGAPGFNASVQGYQSSFRGQGGSVSSEGAPWSSYEGELPYHQGRSSLLGSSQEGFRHGQRAIGPPLQPQAWPHHQAVSERQEVPYSHLQQQPRPAAGLHPQALQHSHSQGSRPLQTAWHPGLH